MSSNKILKVMRNVLILLFITAFQVFSNDVYPRKTGPDMNLNDGTVKELKSNVQPEIISGNVKDENGEPMIGVTVSVKGTTIGTITDAQGNYGIEVPDNAEILVFSFIGMKMVEIPIGAETIINIVMEEELYGIDEVVAIGYGSQIKRNLSSSISVVDNKRLLAVTAPSFEAALQGRAAGVQVTSSSALAGSAVRVRIRGVSSASGNSEPLYVIDGIPMESGEISTSQPGGAVQEWNLQQAANTNVLASLNTADIESIEILKDAASAAIYGSRGANGVVLITTKRGKPGKAQFNASASFGLSDATHRIKLLNSEQYIELAQEAWTNSGFDINDFWEQSGVLVDGLTREEALNTDTDWIDEVLQIGKRQDYNISVSGGSEKTTYYMSANLKDEETILRGNDYQRFGVRINMEHRISNRFNVEGKIMMSHVDDQQVATSWAGGVGKMTDFLPVWPVYKEDGSYFRLNSVHPVAGIDLREINLRSNQFLGNWAIQAKILEGLNFRSEFGTSLLLNDDFHYRPGRITAHGRTVSSTVLGNRVSWNLKNILNYKKRIKEHNIDILVATEANDVDFRSTTLVGDTYLTTTLKKPMDAEIQKAAYFETGYSFMSYIGRLNYDLKGRYLISMSIRTDGSSRFAKNNRWGYFPAGSVGYIISEEKYFNPLLNVINFLKLRASYGIVGNSEIGDYRYFSSYSTVSYDRNSGISLSNLGDDELRWEKTAQLDLGITWEAFDGKISGEFDYYDKKTTDLLLPYPVSTTTGVSSITKNIGELSNKGIDIMLNTLNIRTDKFTWETIFTFNHNENKVISFTDELGEGLESTTLFAGYPVGTNKMTQWGGVDPATGEDIYIDSEGNRLLYSDLISEYRSLDNFYDIHGMPTGNPWPKFTGGIDNSFSYKNWYMNFQFTYAAGMDYWLGELKRTLAPFGSSKVNPHTIVLDRWQNPGDDAKVSQLFVENVNWRTTTEHLYRIDYLRLRNLTFGYRFQLKENPVFKEIHCYARLTNLLTFTNAPDFLWDPEYAGVVQSRESNNLGSASDYQTAPQAKIYMIGLSVDF